MPTQHKYQPPLVKKRWILFLKRKIVFTYACIKRINGLNISVRWCPTGPSLKQVMRERVPAAMMTYSADN